MAIGKEINSQKKVDSIAPVILKPIINNINKHNSVIILLYLLCFISYF